MTMITKKSIRDSFRSTKQAKAAEIAALQEQIAAVRAELNAIRAEEKAQLATVPTKVKAEIKTASKLHPLADLLVIPAIGTLPALPAEEAVQHPHYTRIERFWPKAVTNSTRWTHEEAEKCTAFEEAIEAAPDMPLTNASQVLQELRHWLDLNDARACFVEVDWFDSLEYDRVELLHSMMDTMKFTAKQGREYLALCRESLVAREAHDELDLRWLNGRVALVCGDTPAPVKKVAPIDTAETNCQQARAEYLAEIAALALD